MKVYRLTKERVVYHFKNVAGILEDTRDALTIRETIKTLCVLIEENEDAANEIVRALNVLLTSDAAFWGATNDVVTDVYSFAKFGAQKTIVMQLEHKAERGLTYDETRALVRLLEKHFVKIAGYFDDCFTEEEQ